MSVTNISPCAAAAIDPPKSSAVTVEGPVHERRPSGGEASNFIAEKSARREAKPRLILVALLIGRTCARRKMIARRASRDPTSVNAVVGAADLASALGLTFVAVVGAADASRGAGGGSRSPVALAKALERARDGDQRGAGRRVRDVPRGGRARRRR